MTLDALIFDVDGTLADTEEAHRVAFNLAFGRQRWGIASAYSVLLFLIVMTLGYFYVRALSGGERKEHGA